MSGLARLLRRHDRSLHRDEGRRRASLSPFDSKSRLVELAKHRGERLMLNAGSGKPNWLVVEPRAAFVLLGAFALAESMAESPAPGFGGLPKRLGAALRVSLANLPDDAYEPIGRAIAEQLDDEHARWARPHPRGPGLKQMWLRHFA